MLGVLGTGAFATVFRAHDPSLDADVAVKLLADHHSLDPQIRARFISEGRMLRRVAHRNVVAVHDIGEHDGRPFLVMELVDGGTLSDVLGDDSTLDLDGLTGLVGDLAGGLGAVHDAGLVHRDVSPNNVLHRSTGEFVIGDFGLARDAKATGITVGGGTDAYMAPEQRRPGTHVDARADVHAASAVVARAAFGPRWTEASAGTDPLAFELGRGLEIDPRERHASMTEWGHDVASALGERREIVAPEPRRSSRLSTVVGTIVALLVIAAMLAALIPLDRDGSDGIVPSDVVIGSGEPVGPQVIGPDEILLGDVATFDHPDVAGRTYQWGAPDGARIDGETVVYSPSEPGGFEIVLVETDGASVRATLHRVVVRTG